MFKSTKEVMEFIREQGIQMVDFKMVDINGAFRHVTIPASGFSEDLLKDGVGFDASNYGYAVVEKSDMVFIPDIETAMIDPFCEIPTLSMSGNVMIIDYPNNRPLPQYPRNIVQAAIQYMKDTGIADTMLILPEFEFYLLDAAGWKLEGRRQEAHVDADQAHWNSETQGAGNTLRSRMTPPTIAAAKWYSGSRKPAFRSNTTTRRSAPADSLRSSRSSANC